MSRRAPPTVFAAPHPAVLGAMRRPAAPPRPLDGSWAGRGSARAGVAGLVALLVAVLGSTASAGVIAAVAISRIDGAAVDARAAPKASPTSPATRPPRVGAGDSGGSTRSAPHPRVAAPPARPASTAPAVGGAEPPRSMARVTVYSAEWCGACRSLKAGLEARGIPYAVVDVDRDPSAFQRARVAAGARPVIPLTEVERGPSVVWVQGGDVAGVERAYRGRGATGQSR
ncbi:MAG: hypothetical protein IT374_23620 [Polyangiaceae bacterium]|nr:hypothetical protein [Polyangiaceae bacterium]